MTVFYEECRELLGLNGNDPDYSFLRFIFLITGLKFKDESIGKKRYHTPRAH